MDNYYDEIELEYTVFLAEQELFDNLLSLGASVHHESVGLMLIKEDYNSTVNKYIEKIVAGIQRAWNTFKDKVINAVVKPVLDNVNKKIDTYEGGLEVQYWHTYNMPKYDAIKMVDFDMELLNNAQNKTDYYSNAYPGVFTNKEKSLKENIIDQVINTEDTHVVTQEDMANMLDFCTRGFKERSTKLEGDLKRLNTNINTMKVSINASTVGGETQNTQTVTQQTVVQNSADILSDLYESYSMNILNEAEDNNNKSTKVVNNGDSGNNENTPQKNNVKKMTWYLSGNTDVFSAKMKIMRQRYLDCIKIFRAAFPKEKEKKETNQVEVKGTNAQQIEV